MTPEFWAIIAVGIGIAGLFFRMDTRIGRLGDHVRDQGERLARLEGKVDTLITAFGSSPVHTTPFSLAPRVA